jgi:hypothetical protein
MDRPQALSSRRLAKGMHCLGLASVDEQTELYEVVKCMEVLNKLWSYLTFRKPEEGAPSSFNLKVMHGINKISILMFLAGILFVIIRNMLR